MTSPASSLTLLSRGQSFWTPPKQILKSPSNLTYFPHIYFPSKQRNTSLKKTLFIPIMQKLFKRPNKNSKIFKSKNRIILSKTLSTETPNYHTKEFKKIACQKNKRQTNNLI